MSGCSDSKVKLFYVWKQSQKKGMDEDWYYDQYHKYVAREVKKCRERTRKAKRE